MTLIYPVVTKTASNNREAKRSDAYLNPTATVPLRVQQYMHYFDGASMGWLRRNSHVE